MTPLIWCPFVLYGGRPNLPRLSLSAFLVWFLSGVILLLTQTMHYYKGNPSESYICIFWSPQKGNLMPPAFFPTMSLCVSDPAAPIVHSPHVLELSTFPPGFGPETWEFPWIWQAFCPQKWTPGGRGVPEALYMKLFKQLIYYIHIQI